MMSGEARRGIVTTVIAAALAAVLAVAHLAAGDDDRGEHRSRTYEIGLWGDLPYSVLQATVGVPNMIADMNAQKLAFVAHDGDLKAGAGECTDAVYAQALKYFASIEAPVVFTPGDNDWTDCDRVAGYSSLAQLDKERALFFSTPFSLGQRRFRQEVQSGLPFCRGVSGLVPCVENRRWVVGDVTYATLNVQGSCNNLCDTAPDVAEWQARNQANIAWLHETFESAARRRSVAVMLIAQANPGWDASDTRGPLRDPRTLAETDGQPDGFQAYLLALREEVIAFRRPVAYVHGDSHYFRIDKPFLDAQGRRLENFTRVETFGDNAQNGNNDVQWLKVVVDPRSREVFSYEPQIVPLNRTAVPAP